MNAGAGYRAAMTLSPLWQDRSGPLAELGQDLPAEADVVVVGAGITGLTTALQVARTGRRVVVVEARALGESNTGRSTAKVSLLQGTRLSGIDRRQSSDVVRTYVEANRAGQSWLRHFCEEQGVAYETRAAVTYANTARGVRTLRHELDLALAAGLPASWHDDVGLPFPTRGGVHLPDQGQVDPMELLDALVRVVREHDVVVVGGSRVHKVAGSDPVRVDTERGAIRARTVVLATGLPILDRGAFFARATAQRSYSLAFAVPEQPVQAMYLSADQPSRSLRDATGGRGDAGPVLLVGGAGHGTGRSGSPHDSLEELRAFTAQHFPGARETHAWSAQDYVPTRGLPYVGTLLPGSDHLLVAGGFAKWGMTNGVAAALALAARIEGGEMAWSQIFDPWTRRELGGLPGAAVANAEVGLSLTSGWLRPLARAGRRPEPEEGEGATAYDRPGAPSATSHVDGVDRRVSGVCTHLGGVVRWNDAERSWDCPLHGSRFDADGSVLEGVATCGLRRLEAAG